MNTPKRMAAIIGFLIFGLSPSFVDWQESPDKRGRMIGFYVVGLSLVYYGLLS